MQTDRKFQEGDYVRKTKGSWWEGYVRGFYDTEDNQDGICVQLDKPRGPVQLYPAAAFELAAPPKDPEPLFWYRPVGEDGGYEGPHHVNSTFGRLAHAAKPDEWKPLYAHPPAPQDKTEGDGDAV